MVYLNSQINKISLKWIIGALIFFRILSIIFSKGYAFSDDHFETVALADEYLIRKIEHWKTGEIYLFNLLYPYMHAFVMKLAILIGLNDPQNQMLLVRFLHAILNIIMIIGAGKLAKLHFQETGQKLVILILGLFWMFPFMSVRSLREMACMPFLVWGFYYLEKTGEIRIKNFILAGLFFSIAFVIRIQTVFFAIGVGLYSIFSKKWKVFLYITFFTLLWYSFSQFLFDFLYWGDPFGSLKAYIFYNLNNSGNFPNGPWYMFLLTVLGFCIPPFSLFVLSGYIKSHKHYPYVFWGSISFFIFHSIFPNKQERFILPFIILFLTLGILKLWELKNNLTGIYKKIFNASTMLFVFLNSVALILLSLTYSKKSRVEAMYHFYEKDFGTVLVSTYQSEVPMLPHFYHQKPKKFFKNIDLSQNDSILRHFIVSLDPQPTHFIHVGNIGLDNNISKIEKLGFRCIIEKNYEPSFTDKIAFWLNPKHNLNETWTICKLQR
jgi:hypothetical protein